MNKETIKAALSATPNGDFSEKSKDLLATIGYQSELTLELSDTVHDFFQEFPPRNPNTKTEQEFRKHAQSAQIIFQFTSDEITDDSQQELFEADAFDKGNIKSFLFCAVELKNNNYSRTKYAEFTREINKRLFAPTVILFRAGDRLTVAFADRRPDKTDEDRDVLGQVTLIKDIRLNNPHRAHLDILSELSLEVCAAWMDANNKPKNFDGLLAAWLAKLDTEELNKQFYRNLFAWYEWAIETATFPTDENRTLKPAEHVIRLITRLLFIWFIKEKGLVADALFNKSQIQDLLAEDDFDNGDAYYRAVLQNLFFATLNTEIDERKFSKESRNEHRNFSRYRYKIQMRDPDRLLELFDQTPFINGGLFDCLDSFSATGEGGYRIDCFSDKQYHKLSIPNRLFFDAQQGLIPLLEHYKFTVEENTPIEQEVALDPELLGRVFEHLLGEYNPQTRERAQTARKGTGTYYTLRSIVDYMVDEALVATLSQKCSPTDGDTQLWEERLRYLLDYAQIFDDASEWFDDRETDAIVKTISELKILDPAVGSGAFPMGILHKLTLALKRLDMDNSRWEQLQKDLAGKRAAEAFNTQNQQERDAKLTEISDIFERYRDSDFGRKLYLIQNSIFGVDIEPIACQIAKLRFFISLAIEQKTDRDANNFGIKPLPNLETRFIAADALVGLEIAETRELFQEDTVQQLLEEVESIREKYFLTNNRQQKLDLEDQEDKYRERLKTQLEVLRTKWIEKEQQEIERKIAQFPNLKQSKELREEEEEKYKRRKAKFDVGFEDARKIANWKPYDQNATSEWFDPEWMFRFTDGFDVVIGNPPYVESRNSLLTDEQKVAYGKQVVSDWKESLPRGSDLLIYFYARSPKFLNKSGNGCFITQNAWLNTDYGHKFQQFSLNKFSFLKIIDSSSKFFSDSESQNINTIITLFTKRLVEEMEYGIVDANLIIRDKKVIRSNQLMKWGHIFSMPEFYREILGKMTSKLSISGKISFGQGLNFPLSQLSDDESDLPVIVKSAQFVAISAEKRTRVVLGKRRKDKVPALVMPRGIGARHYCTFNSCRAFSYSHVELYLPEDLWNSDMHYCLWIYLNSSFVWLFREITGRKNLGGGLLKAEATDMKMLPVNFNFDFAQEAKQVFNTLKDREPLPVSKEIYTDEHSLIDDIVADYFGFQDRLEDIRNTLIEQVNFRLSRAKSSK
ncbi:MAG: Eco57I restriction-modification methylase domain-containing protein [Candidatus Poribacteria bacterium]|nr:Eco57I restriction-modification methylase domain-containing protein [Candidatus Poribacteria bacterium]